MNCQVENYKSYDVPTVAGNFRVLLGLLLAFTGIYIAALTDVQGHGLALLLVIASPFVILKDKK